MNKVVGGFAQRNSISFMDNNFISTSKMLKNGKIENNIEKRKVQKIKTPILLVDLLLNIIIELPKKVIISTFAIIFMFSIFMQIFIKKIEFMKDVSISNQSLIVWIIEFVLIALFTLLRANKEHGAEHIVYNAGKTRDIAKINLNDIKKFSRLSEDCGSRFFFLFFITQVTMMLIFRNIFVSLIAIELVLQFDYRFGIERVKPINKINMFLQKHIFTRKPDLKQLQIAVNAYVNLIENWNKGR